MPIRYPRRPLIALGRDFEEPMTDHSGKSVLITGGTGSFGSTVSRRLLARRRC